MVMLFFVMLMIVVTFSIIITILDSGFKLPIMLVGLALVVYPISFIILKITYYFFKKEKIKLAKLKRK